MGTRYVVSNRLGERAVNHRSLFVVLIVAVVLMGGVWALGRKAALSTSIQNPPDSTQAGGWNLSTQVNDAAAVRGMVLLGRCEQALQWHGGTDFLPARISEHPEVSTARFLVRALFETGDAAGAEDLARRIALDQTEPMLCWLANLVRVEVLLGRSRELPPTGATLDDLRADLSRICRYAPVLPVEIDQTKPWLNGVYF